MSLSKDLFEPVSPPRRGSEVEPSSKKVKLQTTESTSPSKSKSSEASLAAGDVSQRSTHRESSKLTATLKPLLGAPPAEPPPVTVVEHVEEPSKPSLKDLELARWSSAAVATIPSLQSNLMSDDAVIRRKLMFEAGNPPASSHRGIKLLAASIGYLVNAVRLVHSPDEIESIAQRVQLSVKQEELTLVRLTIAGEAIKNTAEAEARYPVEIALHIEDVKLQTANQQKKLEMAGKTDARFKEYVDMANSIRKLPSHEELLKTRNELKEETNRLKEELEQMERLQGEKYPFLMIANWAMNNIKFGTKKIDPSKSKTRVVSLEPSKKREATRHKKSPKKSSKEQRNP